MQVKVEFYGIPRARAGTAQATASGQSLGDVLADLAAQFPALAEACIDGRCLRPAYLANLGGRQFVTAPDTKLAEGETVLLMSADAGG